MKALILGLAVGSVAFAGSSIYLWQQLDDERAHAVQVEKTTQELKARIAELEKTRSELAQRRVVSNGSAVYGSFGAGESVALPPPPPAQSAAAKSGEPELAAWTVQRQEPSPAMRKMMRTQMRANNKRIYADVGSKLGLNKETTSKLIDLLTEQQTSGTNFFMLPGDDPEEAGRRMEQIARDNETAIYDLIGPDKAMGLKEYQQTIPARQDVDMLVRQLENNEVKVSDEQRSKLVDVYIEERARVPYPQPYENMDGEAFGKSMAAWQEDYEKRVTAEVGRILDSSQLAAYNEIQQWHREMRAQFTPVPGGVMQLRRGVPANAMTFSTAAPAVSFSVEGVSSALPAQEQKKP
jgi:hypothetical protein